MVQWIKKEPFIEIKELKEHTDYSVVCTLDNSNNVKANVRCTLCRKTSAYFKNQIQWKSSYASFQLDQPH